MLDNKVLIEIQDGLWYNVDYVIFLFFFGVMQDCLLKFEFDFLEGL